VKNRLLIYGATGFTGELIAREAKDRWQREDEKARQPLDSHALPRRRAWYRRPALAGRDPVRLRVLGKELTLPWIAVRLDDMAGLDRALQDVAVVLNAAGPYGATAEPMVKACLRTGTHYLDVCGAFEILRRLDDYHGEAVERGVLLMPAAGFTVVASDYLVACLKRAMPDLWYLRIALSRVDFVSRGSMKSMQEAAREGVSVRRSGAFITVPVGQLERAFPLRDGASPSVCTAIRSADLITAPLTTQGADAPNGVPNIETYLEANALERLAYQVTAALALPLQLWPIKQLVDANLALWPASPSESDRASAEQTVLVEGEDRYRSRRVTFRLHTGEVYEFTAWAAMTLVETVLTAAIHDELDTFGFRSPAGTYFAELDRALVEKRVTIDGPTTSGLGVS
jgi:short subunit dehydrogenase-like uncharacterized protein